MKDVNGFANYAEAVLSKYYEEIKKPAEVKVFLNLIFITFSRNTKKMAGLLYQRIRRLKCKILFPIRMMMTMMKKSIAILVDNKRHLYIDFHYLTMVKIFY